MIDFSDIIYRGYFYYPRINITASTSRFSFSTAPNFGGAGGWGTSIQNVIFMGSLIPVTVVPAKIKPTAFPLVLFNCEIKPGDRCCDRFYWDGKDKEREKDCDSCNDKDNKDIEKDEGTKGRITRNNSKTENKAAEPEKDKKGNKGDQLLFLAT